MLTRLGPPDHSRFRFLVRDRLPALSLALMLSALAGGSCAPDPAGQAIMENSLVRSAQPEAPARSTPMDKLGADVMLDLTRIFGCDPKEIKWMTCTPRGEYFGHITIFQPRDRVVKDIVTAFNIAKLDKKHRRRLVTPPDIGSKLLHYLFPWWKDSDAWLNHAIAVGQRKTSLHYTCPLAVHWRGIYIVAGTHTADADSSTVFALEVTRFKPSNQRDVEFPPGTCPNPLEILEIGPDGFVRAS